MTHETTHVPINIRVPANLRLNGGVKWHEKDGKLFGSVCITEPVSGAKVCVTASSIPLNVIRKQIARAVKSGSINIGDDVIPGDWDVGDDILDVTEWEVGQEWEIGNRFKAGDDWEVGWNPFKSIANAGRWLGKTVKGVAQSKIAKKLTGLINNPTFQSIIKTAAPIGLAAFGVPPALTAKAMDLVSKASQGFAGAKNKVANIADLAKNQGYLPAQQLWNVMSTYYRGGTNALMQAPPNFSGLMPWALPQMNPQQSAMMQQQAAMRQQQQAVQQRAQQMMQQQMQQRQMMQRQMQMMQMQLPPQMRMQMPQMPTPFSMPWGQMRISGWVQNVPYHEDDKLTPCYKGVETGDDELAGWLYNIPYRSVIDYKLSLKEPGTIARGAYQKGMEV